MAGNPAAVVSVAGTVRTVERFDTKADETTGEVRQAARVTVLTEPNGGFAEVYVGSEDLGALAAVSEGDSVHWAVTCRAGNKAFTRADGTRSAPYAQLWLRFVSEVADGAGARRLSSAASA
jgi:hypothetical protein